MSKYVATESPGFFRDTTTGAVINRNTAELNHFKNERARLTQQQTIQKKVDELSTSISEIKEILKYLVNRTND